MRNLPKIAVVCDTHCEHDMKKERRLKQTLELYTVYNKQNTRDRHTKKGGTMCIDDLTLSLINYALCILGKGLALLKSRHILYIFLNFSIKFTLIKEFPSVKCFNTNIFSQQKHSLIVMLETRHR